MFRHETFYVLRISILQENLIVFRLNQDMSRCLTEMFNADIESVTVESNAHYLHHKEPFPPLFTRLL